MSDLNTKAYDMIDQIESYYDMILDRLYISELLTQNTRQETENLRLQLEQTQKELTILQNKPQIPLISEIVKQNFDGDGETLELRQKIAELESKTQDLEDKYQATYRLLQKEMVKVDTMQMELELAQRERDVSLRKSSMTSEQKQLLVKLEYENYKINETIERIDYISETLRKILGDKTEDEESVELVKEAD